MSVELLKNIVLRMNSVIKKLTNVSKLTAVDMLCVKRRCLIFYENFYKFMKWKFHLLKIYFSPKPILPFSVIAKTVIVSVLPMNAKLKSVEQILTAKKLSVIDTVVGKHKNSVFFYRG